MAASSSSAKPTVGILSIGDMGMGIAKLLRAHDYNVSTVAVGRSQQTLDRIKLAEIVNLPNDEAFVAESDIILSIVPPRDSITTAKRIAEACRTAAAIKHRNERRGSQAGGGSSSSSSRTTTGRNKGIVYIDLNAISPRTVKAIASLFSTANAAAAEVKPAPFSPSILTKTFSFHRTTSSAEQQQESSPSPSSQQPITIEFLDGGIIGPPPRPSNNNNNNSSESWTLPSLVVSGPSQLLDSPFQTTLNINHISPEIGIASTLKSCFASLTKGLTALSILSFTTAHQANILPHLQSHLEKYSPQTLSLAQKGLIGMPPKAYRWVDEMIQIGETFNTVPVPSPDISGEDSQTTITAAFPPSQATQLFGAISEIYRFIAEETVLGQEKIEKRKRGKDVADVAEAVREGLVDRKRKRRASRKNSSGAGRLVSRRSTAGGGGGAGGSVSGPGGAGMVLIDDEDEEGALDVAWRGSWT